MVLPDPNSDDAILTVTPDFGQAYFSATEAEVIQTHTIRIESIFDENNLPSSDDYPITVKFSIDGITN